MKSNYIRNIKKGAKRFLGEVLPERQYVVGGSTFLVNRKDSAFGIFENASCRDYSTKEYADAAVKIFMEIGDGTGDGIHPKLKKFRPRVSSWIPYFPRQTTAYVYNFLSAHYGLNNPFAFVFRYVIYRESVKVVDQAHTKVLLPNSMCCINDPESFCKTLESECEGRLVIYVYDPLFKPITNEFRFFGAHQSNDLRRCAVHSWVSAQQNIFKGKRRFGFRNRIPSLEVGESYEYCQEIFSPFHCATDHKKVFSSLETDRHDSQISQPARAEDLVITDGSLIYTEGYFIGRDDKGNVSRIWHDNGDAQTTTRYPAEKRSNDFTIETDFYIPAKGYFAKIVFANPIGNNILVGHSITVSAYRLKDRKAFYAVDVAVNVGSDATHTEFYQLDLKEFCERAQEFAVCESDIFQITVAFKPVGSNITIPNINDVQVQIFLYSNNGRICDQYHSSVSYSSLFNPLESPRSNKFCPFYIDKLHASFLIINNKFPAYMSKTANSGERDHKIKLTLHLNNELETQIKFITTSSSDKFYAVNIREAFNLPEGVAHDGILHVFCATANFGCYFMTIGRNESDYSLLCDHLTGG